MKLLIPAAAAGVRVLDLARRGENASVVAVHTMAAIAIAAVREIFIVSIQNVCEVVGDINY